MVKNKNTASGGEARSRRDKDCIFFLAHLLRGVFKSTD